MGLDIEARRDGEVVAELRINIWDYVRRGLWERAMEPYYHGGHDIPQSHFKTALSRIEEGEIDDWSKWEEKAERAKEAVGALVEKETGSKVSVGENPSEDQAIESYEEVRRFLRTCHEQDVDRVKVI